MAASIVVSAGSLEFATANKAMSIQEQPRNRFEVMAISQTTELWCIPHRTRGFPVVVVAAPTTLRPQWRITPFTPAIYAEQLGYPVGQVDPAYCGASFLAITHFVLGGASDRVLG